MGQRSSAPRRTENTVSPQNNNATPPPGQQQQQQAAPTAPQKPSEQQQRSLASPCVVLITGCSSGLGAALAVLLAKDADKRFKVYATMRNLDKKGALVEAGKEALDDTLFIRQLDVCSDESVAAAVEEVQQSEGRIDVLVNNAGVGLVSVLESIPVDTAKKVFDVNFFGVMRMLKAVLPGMKARQDGLIINLSGVLGVVGKPFNDIFSASKFAVEGLTESLVPVLNQFNIRCCLLEPGPMQTDFAKSAKALREAEIDMSAVDPKSQQILGACFKVMYDSFVNKSESADQVAAFVKNVIPCEKPSVRYQTNPRYGVEEVPAKLLDPSGNKPVQVIEHHFGL